VKSVSQPIERRASRRFPLALPVLFRWTDYTEHYDVGHCANAGLDGMFVLSANCPPVGTHVDIDLNIPACDLVPRRCQLRCTGRVMRIEGCCQLRGFAVVGRVEDSGRRDDAIEIEEVVVALRTKQQ
jgi:hypothetical protein